MKRKSENAGAATPVDHPPDNQEIADVLGRVGQLLELQDANPHRVRAYRHAAQTIASQAESVAALADEGAGRNLEDLPGIGRSLAESIREFARTGRLRLLDRLEGEVSPEDLFCTIPGIGEELARRIHEELHIETLEELEIAAHDRRLASVPGMGERRLSGTRATLESMLSKSTRRRARQRRLAEAGQRAAAIDSPQPSVGAILDIDAKYRREAQAGKLRKIPPRRFNPKGEAWLPILHTELKGWSFTALFSNTARAHNLGMTKDWVVLFFERDGHEDQCTAVTETHGELKGRRVVRGREPECLRHYARRRKGSHS